MDPFPAIALHFLFILVITPLSFGEGLGVRLLERGMGVRLF